MPQGTQVKVSSYEGCLGALSVAWGLPEGGGCGMEKSSRRAGVEESALVNTHGVVVLCAAAAGIVVVVVDR
jgi:hypothetical protein